MAGSQLGAVVRRIERIFTTGSVAGLSEGELLERFTTRGDEAAFEAILARHGPMVLGICRRVLRDPADVEDAFQATFLVLVRKASALRHRDLLGNWLFGVASRVALRARSVAQRRRTVEGARIVDDPPAPAADHALDQESGMILHEELRALPEKYRTPILLCYLEGLTHEEAARQLGWPVGTVKGRLARLREMLRMRLTRRGLQLSASAVLAAVARQAEATVPAALFQSTIKAAQVVAAGRALAAGVVAANVAALIKGATDAMFLNTLKLVAMVLVAGVLTTGAGVWAFQARESPPQQAKPTSTQTTSKAPASAQAFVVNRSGREAIEVLAPQIAARNATPATRALLAKLEESISMSFANETPIEDVLKYIKSATQGPNDIGIAIYVDPLALKELKIDPATATVTMDLEGVSLRTTLRLALKQLNLAYCVKDGMVIISSVEGVLQELKEAEAAAEVAAKFPPPAPPPPALKAKEGALKKDAPPAPSPAEPEGVETPQANHPPDIGMLKSEALQKRLDEPATLAFPKETPLEDVLRYLSKAAQAPGGAGLTIYVDPRVRAKLKDLVQIDLQGVPLRTTLALLMNQVGLAWSVQDGLLIIATQEKIERVASIASQFSRALPPRPGTLFPTGRSAEIVRKLDAPVTVSFADATPLGEVITAIRKTIKGPEGAEIPIYFGPAVSLLGESGFSETKVGEIPVQIDLKDVPLRTCLALLLAQPLLARFPGHSSELDGRIMDGVLIIGESSWLQSLQLPEGGFGGGMGGMGGGMGGMGGGMGGSGGMR